MTSNNNMGSYNKIEKLEEKKKLELQFLKIKYELSANKITKKNVIIDDKNIKEIENVIIDDKNIKEIEKEFMKLSNKFPLSVIRIENQNKLWKIYRT